MFYLSWNLKFKAVIILGLPINKIMDCDIIQKSFIVTSTKSPFVFWNAGLTRITYSEIENNCSIGLNKGKNTSLVVIFH